MKLKPTPILLVVALSTLSTNGLWAGADSKDITPVVAETPETPIAQEFSIENSYSGKAEIKQGNAKLGNIDNLNSHVDYVVSPQIRDGLLLRVGADAERNSFGLFPGAPLPNTLQSVNAIIGADFALNDQILMRAEFHPGIYSDFVNVTGSDFDMPAQIGGTYLLSSDVQIIFGLQIDLKSDVPIIGAPGIRWQFADKWVLSAIPPKPQLQYEVSKCLTLYTGAEVLDGTYHLNNSFGTNHGPVAAMKNYNGNIIDFTEIRVGVGATWKFTPNLTLDASAGYMPYRSFDVHADRIGFETHGTLYHNNIGDGSAYGEIGISGSF